MPPIASVAAAAVESALRRVEVWPPDLPALREDPSRGAAVPLAALDLEALAAAIGRRLGGPPARVAHSAVVMGVASRLWSLTVVPAARDRVLPDVATLTGRDDAGALVLGVARFAGLLDPTPDDVHTACLGVLGPIVERVPLAPRLLWGNVAASLHAVPRVHGCPQARTLVSDLLTRTPYVGELDDPATQHPRRRTCCLFYLVPGAGLCGDCVFTTAPGSS